jgi:hypothetical protein
VIAKRASCIIARKLLEFSADVHRDGRADRRVSVENRNAQLSDSESSVFERVGARFSANEREYLRRIDIDSFGCKMLEISGGFGLFGVFLRALRDQEVASSNLVTPIDARIEKSQVCNPGSRSFKMLLALLWHFLWQIVARPRRLQLIVVRPLSKTVPRARANNALPIP